MNIHVSFVRAGTICVLFIFDVIMCFTVLGISRELINIG